MNPIAKDVVQIIAWAVAIVGGLVAAFKALDETRENRRQRVRELRWKKAELAREILDKLFLSKRFHDAVTMVDWTGRDYEVAPSNVQEIKWEDLPGALRLWEEPISFDEKEVYIRDCFDELFDGLNLLEHYLRTDLLDFKDVEFPMAYYIGKIVERGDDVSAFMNHYGYRLAKAFIERFPKPPANKSLQPTSGAAGSGRAVDIARG
jgi:hypothetical protein